MTAQHSPTPWRADEYAHETRGSAAPRLSIHASNRRFVADLLTLADRPISSESRANADFIIECVNSHASLLAENQRLREALERANKIIGQHPVRYTGEDTPSLLNRIQEWHDWMLPEWRAVGAALSSEREVGRG